MPVTFRDQIAANKRNSVLLVVVFVLFTACVAITIALAVLLWMNPNAAPHINLGHGVGVGILAAITSFGISMASYYAGDQLILGVHGAREMAKADDAQLFNVVEEMAIAAGLPMPKIYLIDDPAPNAFATGRDPEHAVVAVTTGLRSKLNREELQGVVAHEIAHIRNFDIRLMLLMAALVGTIAMLSDFFWQALRWGGRSSSSSSSGGDGEKKTSLILFFLIIGLAILFAILAPILASLLQFAVSRQREFLADASGVEFTRNPVGLANALKKLSADPMSLASANRRRHYFGPAHHQGSTGPAIALPPAPPLPTAQSSTCTI